MYNPNPPPYAPNYPPGPGYQGGFAPVAQNPVVTTGFAPVVQSPVVTTGFVPVVQNPVVTTVTQVLAPPTDGPSMMFCTFCQRTITSRTSFEIGLMTWAVCGGLFLLGCFPCMCIPCCLDSCKDVMHYCPHCNRLLQTYKRM